MERDAVTSACRKDTFYLTPRGLVTERTECLLPPANNYQIRLLKDAQPLGDWSFAGLNAEGWMAFDEHGRLIRSQRLPRGLFWLVFAEELFLDADARVVEEGLGAGEWERFHHRLVNTTDAESLAFSKTDGDPIKLPLASNRAAVLCGNMLTGCDVAGAPVYIGELPTLQVPLADQSELDRWDVIVEDLTEQAQTRKRLPLSEAAADIEQGCALVPLAQAALLGEPLLGTYRVKLRSHGALGSDQQFQFAFVKEIAYKLDQPFYFSKESPRLTMFTLPSLRVRPEEEAAELKEQDEQDKRDGRWGMIFHSTDRRLTLSLEENESCKLALTFSVPRLQWAVRGLKDVPFRWHSTPAEIQLEDLETADEATLLVQLPVEGKTVCTLELEGANQTSTETIRDGEVRFPLSQFSTSLRWLSQSLARFSVWVPDPLFGTQKMYPLLVRTRWTVEGFEHQDIRTVVFRWADNGRYRNRRLRLWNLSQLWNKPKEYSVEDEANKIEISESFSSLPAGKYRVELLMESQVEVAAPALPPRANGADVFDVRLGEAELVINSLPTFRRCLAHRLAGNEDGFNLNNYDLTEGDYEDLLRALRFLVSEERPPEANRLWFNDLRHQIKQVEVRNCLREQIRRLAEGNDDGEKRKLLAVCKTIGLSVNSLLPFQAGAHVQFDGIPAKFRGVSKWGTPGYPQRQGNPADLIYLVFANNSKQWVQLSEIDRLKPMN